MRVVVTTLLITAMTAVANTYVAEPAKHKETLLGTWEAVDIEGNLYYRMVLLPEDDGYLIWPRSLDKSPYGNAFFGRLAAVEFQNGHVKLLFKQLATQIGSFGGPSLDANIEIEGTVIALEGNEEMKDFAEIKGTTTICNVGEAGTSKLYMRKPAFLQELAALGRRAEESLSVAMTRGPIGTREEALAILRPWDIREGTRVISAEWSGSQRRWVVELKQANGETNTTAVDVWAHCFDWIFPDEEH